MPHSLGHIQTLHLKLNITVQYYLSQPAITLQSLRQTGPVSGTVHIELETRCLRSMCPATELFAPPLITEQQSSSLKYDT